MGYISRGRMGSSSKCLDSSLIGPKRFGFGSPAIGSHMIEPEQARLRIGMSGNPPIKDNTCVTGWVTQSLYVEG